MTSRNHTHDQLRAELAADGLMTAVALRENPSLDAGLRQAMLLKLRQIRSALDHWDDEPVKAVVVPEVAISPEWAMVERMREALA